MITLKGEETEKEGEGEEWVAVRAFVAMSLFMQYVKLKVINREKQQQQQQQQQCRRNEEEEEEEMTTIKQEMNSSLNSQQQSSPPTTTAAPPAADINLEGEFVNECACKKQSKWIMNCIQYYQQQQQDNDSQEEEIEEEEEDQNHDDDNSNRLTAKVLVKLFKQELVKDEYEENGIPQIMKREEEEEEEEEEEGRTEKLPSRNHRIDMWNVRTYIYSFGTIHLVHPIILLFCYSIARSVLNAIIYRTSNQHFWKSPNPSPRNLPNSHKDLSISNNKFVRLF